MTTTAPDVDIVEILSGDEAPCKMMQVPCGRSAVWGLRCGTCGIDAHACTPCRERFDGYLHMLMRLRLPPIDCAGCGTRIPHPSPWRAI